MLLPVCSVTFGVGEAIFTGVSLYTTAQCLATAAVAYGAYKLTDSFIQTNSNDYGHVYNTSTTEEELEEEAISEKGGQRNRFKPDPKAEGAHSPYRRDPESGKTSHYETYRPQTNPRDPKKWESEKRYDGDGKSHRNKFYGERIETPHVHDPKYPGGIRPALDWEIPK